MPALEKRLDRLKSVALKRQTDLSVLLENVHDPHNIGAVLRTCDSVGINEIYILYTDPGLSIENLKLGARSSSGARKWVDVYVYEDVETCFDSINKKYKRVLATHLASDSKSVYNFDLTTNTVIAFGNERDGLSEDVIKRCSGNLIIPQAGMVRSLNISVACAVVLYEAYRQRERHGMYPSNEDLSPETQKVYSDFINKHETRESGELPKNNPT